VSRSSYSELDSLARSAASIVSKITGEMVVTTEKIETGVMAFKYCICTMSDERYIVRFYPESRSFVINYEPDIVRRCLAQGLRVPEVVMDSRSGPPAQYDYMVYRMLPGITLQDRLGQINKKKLQAVCRDILIQLQLMAEIPMQGYGEVLSATHAAFPTWQSFVISSFNEGLAVTQKENLLVPMITEALAAIRSRLDAFVVDCPAMLAWGDISPDNVIVDEREQFVGFVDFEGVIAAEFDLNLGYLRARYEGSDFYAEMATGWPAQPTLNPRVALYTLIRVLRLLRHGRKPLPTGRERDPVEVFLPGFIPALNELLQWMGHPELPMDKKGCG
jgi:aminoglycoside phosphotransferase (APT) family kinase protein